ncbi:hypothetical protein LZ554_007221 [Drepanopeziza brunnea f. sp. 'monogermtubi']|nr:hypothetical protein LZ554_007221 [Drepanopeziza brunnea f. sp. 'monogermtubi']
MASLTGIRTELGNMFTRDEGPTETKLPSGRCNYTNLSVGGNAPVCGCRRFWDKALASPQDRSTARSGFCMCEHHACFHDDGPQQSQVGASADATLANATLTFRNANASLRQSPGQNHGPSPEARRDSIPDTQQWGRYLHSGSVHSLPAIPSQCLLPSDTGSITSGSIGASIRPSGLGQAFNPMPTIQSGIATGQQPQSDRRMQIYEDADGNAFMQSLTEVATPSARASQDPAIAAQLSYHLNRVEDAVEKFPHGDAQVSAEPATKTDDRSQMNIKPSEPLPGHISLKPHEGETEATLLPRLRHLVHNLSEYPIRITNHEQRLDSLENATFHDPAVGDLQDADDRLDNRVCEVEERVREIEKVQAAINDASSVSSKQIESFDSRMSVTSSTMIASAMGRLDAARLQSLESQIAELQAAALPSPSRPWEIEVVFLPFGPQLMGIWSAHQNMSQRSRVNSMATDDWTQTQNHSMAAAQTCFSTHDQASAWQHSAPDLSDQDSQWLMAKACASHSRVDERLRSRGLVKLVRILGPDARDVQVAIMNAFGELPNVLAEDPYSQHDENVGSVPRSLRNFLGLSAPWIPLRKIHRDSCLRYLTPSEMVTPALWTFSFLSASVAMRHKGIRRLYVTQRDSYVQQLGNQSVDWTWQKLRMLPRVYPDISTSLNYTPERDAEEPCWEFDERLDPAHESVHSTFTSCISSLSICSPPHQDAQFEQPSLSDRLSSAAVSQDASTTPTSVAAAHHAVPLSSLRERQPFRPVPIRTTSMPTMIPTKFSNSQHGNCKRRITSLDRESQPSPSRVPSTSTGANITLAKRRRISHSRSRSPSRPRDTPKYSTGPSSPHALFDDAKHDREKEEGMTPFAYATPFSNAPYTERGGKSSIGIYEDGSQDELGVGDDNHFGSTTDEVYADIDHDGDNETGYEAHALSDFGQDDDAYYVHGRLVDEEWEGVQDEVDCEVSVGFGKSGTAPVFGGGSFGRSARERDEDEGSEASSMPSEYPIRQPDSAFDQGVGAAKGGFKIHIDDEVEVAAH